MNPQTPLTNAINYAKANPTSDLAKTIRLHIEDGSFDQQAQKENVDLSVYGRPKIQPVTPVAPEPTDDRNIIQKGLGLFLDPIIQTGVRTGQAVGALGATALGIDPNKIETALNQPLRVPLLGTPIEPRKPESIEKTVGRAVSTVALGAGSAPLAGAGIGLGMAMEKDAGVGEAAISTVAGALGGKILEYGFGAVSPYISKAVAKYGTPLIEQLQKELPDYAKPMLDKIITTGQKKTSSILEQEFQKATESLLPTTGKVTFEDASKMAWADIQPKATPSVKATYGKSGNVTEQGVFSKAQLKPTPADQKVLGSYQKLYEEGTINSKMSYGEKLNAVEQKASQLHQSQKAFLADNDKAVFTDELFSVLDKNAGQNTTIFAKDTSAKGAYDSAVDVFKNSLKTGKASVSYPKATGGTVKGATNLTSIDEALTKFDAEMEKFGAWERAINGTLTETDKARILAIRDIHTATRDFISNQLPKNSPWKAIRLEESQMYQAGEMLAPKLGETVGQSGLSQYLKDHPTLKRGMTWAGLTLLGALGIGGAGKVMGL